VVSAAEPNGRYSQFSRPEPLISLSSHLFSRGGVDPISDRLLLRKSGSAESHPGPLGLQPGTLTTRPQRRSAMGYMLLNMVAE
jgi:hypothetical protein